MDKMLNKSSDGEQQDWVINIYGIEFDWIFNNEEGFGFLEALSETD